MSAAAPGPGQSGGGWEHPPPPASGGPGVRSLENAPGAVGSLVCGILGLFTIPLVLSIVAVVLGNQSRRATAAEPYRYTDQLGQVGRILGWIGIGLAAFGLLVIAAVLVFLMPVRMG